MLMLDQMALRAEVFPSGRNAVLDYWPGGRGGKVAPESYRRSVGA